MPKLRAILGRSFEPGSHCGIRGCERTSTKGVRLAPLNNARQVYLADAAARLLAAAAKTRTRQLPAIVQLLLFTGMRVSELLLAR